MYERILVPTDGSDGTGRVVDRAIDVARTFDAAVHALYVVDVRPYDGVDLADEEAFERTAREAGQRATAQLGESAADAGLEIDTATRTGVPDAEIVAYVGDNDVDLVVMGTRSHGGRTGCARQHRRTRPPARGRPCPHGPAGRWGRVGA